MLARERWGGVWIWTFLMGELCLVPESFLCLELETFRNPGTDTDLERRLRRGSSRGRGTDSLLGPERGDLRKMLIWVNNK